MKYSLPSIEDPHQPLRPARPSGVSILSIWNGVFSGLLPMLTLLGRYTQGDPTIGSGASLAFSIGLASLVMFTAIGTYLGNDRARLGLIWVMTIAQSVYAFDAVTRIASGGLPALDLASAYLRIALSVLWIVINTWYFLRPQTIEYYRFGKNRLSKGG